MEKMIYQYLKNSRGHKKGVMVAVANDTLWALGVSVANFSAGDRFDAGRGIKMAHGRALHALESWQKNQDDAARMKKQLEEITQSAEAQAQVVPALSVHINIPVGVYSEVHEFEERCKCYFKDKQVAAYYHADNVKNMQREVAQLTMLFEDAEKKGHNLIPPSLRAGQQEHEKNMKDAKELAQALELITAKELILKNMKNKQVTRVQKP